MKAIISSNHSFSNVPIFPVGDCFNEKAIIFEFWFSIKGDKQSFIKLVSFKELKSILMSSLGTPLKASHKSVMQTFLGISRQ